MPRRTTTFLAALTLAAPMLLVPGAAHADLRTATKITGKDGWFKKTFTASKDGTWMATYKGSATYIKSSTPGDYVDVR